MSTERTQFIRFLLVGGAAATVNFCSRVVLSLWLPYAAAVVLAYLCGMVTAFLLNRRYVFARATNHIHHQTFWFVLVNIAAIAQTLLVSIFFADYILPRLGIDRYAKEIAHAIGIVAPIFSSYIGHKHLSFPTEPDGPSLPK